MTAGRRSPGTSRSPDCRAWRWPGPRRPPVFLCPEPPPLPPGRYADWQRPPVRRSPPPSRSPGRTGGAQG
ncbi:hypothetical protein STRNTR1_2301 [Stenotrophomonas maltophilia]|nr:hypothetical protein STRNTR1_2301 [Stenotrophomonas maltophilia]